MEALAYFIVKIAWVLIFIHIIIPGAYMLIMFIIFLIDDRKEGKKWEGLHFYDD